MWDVCFSGLEGYEEVSFMEECEQTEFDAETEECLMKATSCEEVENCY
jgi:hypothetical protein